MTLDLCPQQTPPTSPVNLRDVATASPLLAAGILLRSDAPLPGDEHLGYDVTWPPRTFVDLRDPSEVGGDHPFADTAEVIALPVMEGRARDLTAFPPSLGALYLQWLEQPAAGHLVAAVQAIAWTAVPVLVHCAAGKDRTGCAVALTLRLVGIAREQVVADYVRTHDAMAGIRARLATHCTMLDREALDRVPADFGGAPADAITAFLDGLDAHQGGAEGWYLAHGGTPETLAALRARLRAPRADLNRPVQRVDVRPSA